MESFILITKIKKLLNIKPPPVLITEPGFLTNFWCYKYAAAIIALQSEDTNLTLDVVSDLIFILSDLQQGRYKIIEFKRDIEKPLKMILSVLPDWERDMMTDISVIYINREESNRENLLSLFTARLQEHQISQADFDLAEPKITSELVGSRDVEMSRSAMVRLQKIFREKTREEIETILRIVKQRSQLTPLVSLSELRSFRRMNSILLQKENVITTQEDSLLSVARPLVETETGKLVLLTAEQTLQIKTAKIEHQVETALENLQELRRELSENNIKLDIQFDKVSNISLPDADIISRPVTSVTRVSILPLIGGCTFLPKVQRALVIASLNDDAKERLNKVENFFFWVKSNPDYNLYCFKVAVCNNLFVPAHYMVQNKNSGNSVKSSGFPTPHSSWKVAAAEVHEKIMQLLDPNG